MCAWKQHETKKPYYVKISNIDEYYTNIQYNNSEVEKQ